MDNDHLDIRLGNGCSLKGEGQLGRFSILGNEKNPRVPCISVSMACKGVSKLRSGLFIQFFRLKLLTSTGI